MTESFTLAVSSDAAQTPIRNSEGALIIVTHDPASTDSRSPILHVLRQRPPFRYDAPADDGQEAFAQRVLLALRLLPYLDAFEDGPLPAREVAFNVADRAKAEAARLVQVAIDERRIERDLAAEGESERALESAEARREDRQEREDPDSEFNTGRPVSADALRQVEESEALEEGACE